MSLKKASILLIIGLLYTCIYKLIMALWPIVTNITILNTVLSTFWVLSALTIIVFIVLFLKEIKSQILSIKLPLYLTIILTCIVIIAKLPFEIVSNGVVTRRLIYQLLLIINSISILYFLASFYRLNSIQRLKAPIKLMIWGFTMGLILGMIKFGGYLYFIISKTESQMLSRFQVIAIIIFALIYYSIINFLLRFIKVENYSRILKS